MSRLDEFDVVIRRKNGKVIAGIPSLGLYAAAGDTAAALDALEVRKRSYQADLEEAGVADSLDVDNRMASTPAARARPGELRLFALKSVILLGLITGSIVLVGGLLAFKVDETIDRTLYTVRTQLGPLTSAKIGGPQFWSKISSELDRAADPNNNLPADKQEKLLANIRALVNRARPFVAEVAPLFAGLRSPDAQAGGQNCSRP